MSTSPGPLLQALDGLWEHIRSHVPELPPARMAISPIPQSPKHGPERWTWEDEIVTGLVASAETLTVGAGATLEHVLHEAAHVLCWTRDVQDTTMRGVYHNGAFLDAAEEVGLSWPSDQPRVRGKGYVSPVLTDATRARYADDLSALTEAIPLVLPHLVIPDVQRAHKPANRLYLQCQCDEPRRIQISPTVAAKGPVICGVCMEPFTEH
ncbi:hypothetical protein [Streptomyces sp. NPDC002346]